MEVQKQGAGAVVQPPTAGSRRTLALPGQLKASLATSADGLLATFDAILQQITPVEPLRPVTGKAAGNHDQDTVQTQQADAAEASESSASSDVQESEDTPADAAVAVDSTQTVADAFVGVEDSDLNAPVAEEQLQLNDEDSDDELNAAEIVALVDPVHTQAAVASTEQGVGLAEEVAVVQQAEHDDPRAVRGRRRGDGTEDISAIPASGASDDRPLQGVDEESLEAGRDNDTDVRIGESTGSANAEELGWSGAGIDREGRESRVRRQDRQGNERNPDSAPASTASQSNGEQSTVTEREGISIEGLEPVAPEPFSVNGVDPSTQSSGAEPLSVETASVVTAAVRSAAQSTGSEGAAATSRVGSGTDSGTVAVDGPRATRMLSETDKKSPVGQTSATDNAERVKLVQRVARSFQRLGATGGQINMMLHPAELGSVRLNLKVEGNQLDATITTETSEALEVLRENLPELRQRLADFGMEIDRIEFEVQRDERAHRDFDGSGRQSDGQYQPQWQLGQQRRDSASLRPESATNALGARGANRQDSDGGGIRLRGVPVTSGLDLRG